ncbi:PRC-barrel domain-containing protein [Hyphomicrobium sp.]|uniref:PRC-barrel domain-containing protein n=1 Tax=Hyphomicrobium sp. TaxID=82 RepID=UPI002D77A6B1|nr:PRC-barrel domain-containing protein [Hyphomicrobium sp.]HET6389031.1 PRC-barrel domain-containing protein [Hyphomicrobium sp.]
MNKKTLSRAVIIAGLAVSPALMTTSVQALSFVKTQATGEQSTSGLIGLRVENTAGDKLGDINYLVLDNAGKVTTAVIGVGGFLGVGEKNVGVPFNELKFSERDGNRFVLIEANKDALSNAPSYVWTEDGSSKQGDSRGLTPSREKEAADTLPNNTAPSQTQ